MTWQIKLYYVKSPHMHVLHSIIGMYFIQTRNKKATVKIWILEKYIHSGTNAVRYISVTWFCIYIYISGFHCETILHVCLFIWHNTGMTASKSESVSTASFWFLSHWVNVLNTIPLSIFTCIKSHVQASTHYMSCRYIMEN